MKGDKLIDDHVQISINTVRLKTHGKVFEVPIDPDKALEYKEGKPVDDEDIFKADAIFIDAKKGLFASDEDLEKIFGTLDTDTIKKELLEKGEIQFTQEYRDKLKERRERSVLHMLHRNAVDPKTGLPHPETRLVAAMQEANVRIDHTKRAEEQISSIIKKLSPIIPISFERVVLDIHIPASYAAQLRGVLMKSGKIRKEDWLDDGSLLVALELPAGLRNELLDELNSKTHGACTVETSRRVKL